MTRCSVIGCGARKGGNQKSLTLHRLPRSEYKKKIWLEAIGTKNIRTHVKEVYICSLHFHDNAFNKTLDVVRLRDDAIPSHLLLPHVTQENRPDLKPLVEHNYSTLLGVKTAVTRNAPLTILCTSRVPAEASKLGLETATMRCNTALQPISVTSGRPALKLGVKTAVTCNAPLTIPGTSKVPAEASKPGLETATIRCNTALQPISVTSGRPALKLDVKTAVNCNAPLTIPGTTGVPSRSSKPGLETATMRCNTAPQPISVTSGRPALKLGVKTAVTCNAPLTIPGTSGVPSGASKLGLETATTRSNTAPRPISGTPGLPALKLGLKTAVTCNAPLTIPGTSGVPSGASKPGLETATMRCNTAPQPISGTSRLPDFEEEEMEKLKEKCDNLTKKVKRLNEKIRRQNKKIANFKNIIIDLHERNSVNNDSSIVLEDCSEDFLKRQFLILPEESQYSEET